MAEYYLMSQLPALDGAGESAPPPIGEEQFLELCSRFMDEEALRELRELSLTPPTVPAHSRSPLVEAWNEGERNLRLALAKVRAEKLKKPFDLGGRTLTADLIKVATTAAEMDSPLEAEALLHRHRLTLLESLRPMNGFSEDAVFYYGLKLKLILRIRQFDAALGETAYRNIYNSILSGDGLEAIE